MHYYLDSNNIERGSWSDTAAKLSGVVSKETQLSVLSIVDNPKEELERMSEEQESAFPSGYDLASEGNA